MSPDDGRAPEDQGRARPLLELDEVRRRRLRPWAFAGAALVTLVTGSVALSYTSVFGASVVEVEGEERLTPYRVMQLAGVTPGTNVFHLDASLAESRLEDDPWVLDAVVGTSLPGTITISVRERSPVMVFASGDARRYVAGDGTVLGPAPRATALPQVVPAPGASLGRDALRAAGSVARVMAPPLRVRVDSITVADDGTVTLVVDGEVEVRYGDARETTAKAQALHAILHYADDEERGLLEVDVSAPATPTARFVGSQQPSTVPDPSAGVATVDAPGTDAEGEGTPEPTSSPSP